MEPKFDYVAWKKKFLNASKEEQAQMLAERKEQREREEKEREKKIYDERKKLFMERCDIQIALFIALNAGRKATLETLEEFDGKVANARITNKINEKLEKYFKDSKVGVISSLSFDTDYATKTYMGVVKLRVRHYFGSNFYDEFEMKFSLENAERVSWFKTQEYYEAHNVNAELDKRIAERKESKKFYDRDYKRALKIKEAIEKYKNETNFYVRTFIQEHGIISSYPIHI